MNKLLAIGTTFAAAGLIARRFAPKLCDIDWGKTIEAMPDTAPPKWMFTNVSAIRANTERILELLERQTPSGGTGNA
jgi:hypothetical protein